MAQEFSMNLAIGAPLPEFSLPDVSSQALVTPKNFDGAAAVLPESFLPPFLEMVYLTNAPRDQLRGIHRQDRREKKTSEGFV